MNKRVMSFGDTHPKLRLLQFPFIMVLIYVMAFLAMYAEEAHANGVCGSCHETDTLLQVQETIPKCVPCHGVAFIRFHGYGDSEGHGQKKVPKKQKEKLTFDN